MTHNDAAAICRPAERANSYRELKRVILARYKSIHAFCRQHPELKRSTVYQVLAGRYAGHSARQLAAIRAALDGTPPERRVDPPMTADQIADAVQAFKCGECRRLDKRCAACRTQTMREAEVVERLLAGTR